MRDLKLGSSSSPVSPAQCEVSGSLSVLLTYLHQLLGEKQYSHGHQATATAASLGSFITVPTQVSMVWASHPIWPFFAFRKIKLERYEAAADITQPSFTELPPSLSLFLSLSLSCIFLISSRSML
jgi:hypothetical protein